MNYVGCNVHCICGSRKKHYNVYCEDCWQHLSSLINKCYSGRGHSFYFGKLWSRVVELRVPPKMLTKEDLDKELALLALEG